MPELRPIGGHVESVKILKPSDYVEKFSLWHSWFSSHMGGLSLMKGLFLRLLRGQLSLEDSVGGSIEVTVVEDDWRHEKTIEVLKECLDVTGLTR